MRATSEGMQIMDICDYCGRGNKDKSRIIHTDDCPRDTIGARERYNAGYADGRYGADEASPDDLAYRAGYTKGAAALEAWYNADPEACW